MKKEKRREKEKLRYEDLSEETQRSIGRAWDDIKNGRVYDEEQWKKIKKKLKI